MDAKVREAQRTETGPYHRRGVGPKSLRREVVQELDARRRATPEYRARARELRRKRERKRKKQEDTRCDDLD